MIQARFFLVAFAAVLLQITFSSPVEWDENASRELDQELRDRLTVIEAELESIAKAVSEKADEAEAALQHAAKENGLARSQRDILRPFFPLVAEVEGEHAEDEDFETNDLVAEEEEADDEADSLSHAEALEAESAVAPTNLAANEVLAEDLLNGPKKELKESAAAPPAGSVKFQDFKNKAKVPKAVAKKAAKKAAAKKKQKGLSGAGRKKAMKSGAAKAKKGKKSKKGKKKAKKGKKKAKKGKKKAKKGKKKQKGLSAGTRGLNQKEIDRICEVNKGLFNTVHSVAETRQLADQVSRLTDSFKMLKDAIAIARPSVFAPKQ